RQPSLTATDRRLATMATASTASTRVRSRATTIRRQDDGPLRMRFPRHHATCDHCGTEMQTRTEGVRMQRDTAAGSFAWLSCSTCWSKVEAMPPCDRTAKDQHAMIRHALHYS